MRKNCDRADIKLRLEKKEGELARLLRYARKAVQKYG